MFEFDGLREIWSTIKKNKLRTFLTGFSVSWGIFMLIVLLGAGNGLRNGIMYNFRNMSTNMVEVWTRYTTKPYKGMQSNRRVQFKQEDFDMLELEHPEVEYKSTLLFRNDTIAYEYEYITGNIYGAYPDYSKIRYLTVNAGDGRFINHLDIRDKRKVIVLTTRMAGILFRDKSPLGEYVKVGNIMMQVVGVYKDENNSNDAPAYMPFSTAQTLFSKGYGFGYMTFTLKGVSTEEEIEAFNARFRANIARRHWFDPEDKNAIGMWNMANEFRMFNGMMNGIALFIWIIGIGTLMAGIVGVSNIMLITVRERTREFGIRKALGAKPRSILGLIIFESILVTAVFGYIGMLAGIGLTELINYGMEMAQAGIADKAANPGEDMSIFRNPTVNLSISLAATAVLIIAGVLAGYFPARKAVKIPAVDAMRAE